MDCPINQLPLEVLSEIFLHCLPTRGGDVGFHRIPQLLTRVCKRWYTLTYALPALWASLHIPYDSDPTYPPVAAIDTHLQRSSTHPLTFSLRVQYSYYPSTPDLNAILVLVALDTARERWQHVHITLSTAPQATIDAITQGPAPLLQTFHCELDHDGRKPASIPLFAPHACPRLESLAWTGFRNTPVDRPVSDTTWMHLTSLYLEAELSVINCLTLLRLSPRLSTAKLAAIDLPLTQTPLPHLVHQTLHTLRAEGPHATALLSALTLPALAHLRLVALLFTHTPHHQRPNRPRATRLLCTQRSTASYTCPQQRTALRTRLHSRPRPGPHPAFPHNPRRRYRRHLVHRCTHPCTTSRPILVISRNRDAVPAPPHASLIRRPGVSGRCMRRHAARALGRECTNEWRRSPAMREYRAPGARA